MAADPSRHCDIHRLILLFEHEAKAAWPVPDKGCMCEAAVQQGEGVQASKFDMEGSFSPQRFIAYGALAAAPLFDDGRVYGRKDYTYMACARLCRHAAILAISCILYCVIGW